MLKLLLSIFILVACITSGLGQPSKNLVVHNFTPNQYTMDTLYFQANYKITHSGIKTLTEQIHKELPSISQADLDTVDTKEEMEYQRRLFKMLQRSLKKGHFSNIQASAMVVFYEKVDSVAWQENIVVYEWHLKDEKQALQLLDDLNKFKKVAMPYEISVFYDWLWFRNANKVYFIGYVPLIDGGGDLYETVFKNIKKILQAP